MKPASTTLASESNKKPAATTLASEGNKKLASTKAKNQNYERFEDRKFTEKKDFRMMHEIEADLWKNNIRKGPRVQKDFLDVSDMNFATQET